MSIEENKAVVARFMREVINSHDLDALDNLFTPDHVDLFSVIGVSVVGL
jgi:hypothetical protein